MRRRMLVLCGLAGTLFQTTCVTDPLTLFAQVASTVLTDAVFFALDSWLVSIS